MTVSEFAVQMYWCNVTKDRVKIFRDDKLLYDDRMEFLRYAHENFPEKMWFAGETIQKITIMADGNVRELEYLPDYITEIFI